MEKNRTCHLCGKKYSYCPSCDKDKMKPSWYALFCSEQCKSIDETLVKYGTKKITPIKAAKALAELGANVMNIADADIKANIDDIFAASKKEVPVEKSAKD